MQKKIQRNVNRIYEQGGTDSDAEEYIKSQGLNPNSFLNKGERPYDSVLSKIPIVGDVTRPLEDIASAAVDYGSQVAHGGGFNPGEDVKGDLKSALSGGLRAAPMFVTGGQSLLAKAGIQALANAIGAGASKLVETGNPEESLRSGALSGAGAAGITSAMGPAGKVAGAVLSKIEKPAVKTGAVLQRLLASIPIEDAQHAISKAIRGESAFGKGVFGASKESDDIGEMLLAKKAKDAAKYVANARGQSLQGIKDSITNDVNQKTIDTAPIFQDLNRNIGKWETSQGLTSFDQKKVQKISRLIKDLTDGGPINVDKANRIKNNINENVLNKPFYMQTKKMTEEDAIAKQVANSIDRQIQDLEPGLYEANKLSAEATQLSDYIRSAVGREAGSGKRFLGEYRRARIPQTIENSWFDPNLPEDRPYLITMDALNSIEKNAPPELKFMDEAADYSARNAYRPIAPGQGGGSGSASGAENLIRSKTPFLSRGGASWLGISPALNKAMLQGVSKGVSTGKAASPLVQKLLPYIGGKSAEDNNPWSQVGY